MSNRRPKQVASAIQKVLSRILQHKTANLEIPSVSIVSVVVTSDFNWADVNLSFLEEGDEQTWLDQLKSELYEIQGELNDELPSYQIPRLRLHLDEGIEASARIDELLRDDESDDLNSKDE